MPSPTLALTPRGHLLLTRGDEAGELPADRSRTLENAFARGSGHGLLELGAGDVGIALPPDISYWRDFAARFITSVCTHPDLDALPAPALDELETIAATAPPMTGAEYVTISILEALWAQTAEAFHSEFSESKTSVQEFLRRRNSAWHVVGRVHFNLAENRKDDDAPFAFMATYTTQLSTQANAQHLPLGRALSEYAGAANKSRLLSLLLPMQRAAVLYGIGARLDHQPELLFTLRKVDHQALIARAGAGLSKKRKGASGAKVLKSDDLAGVFGIEMAPAAAPAPTAVRKVPAKPSKAATRKKPRPKRRAGVRG